MARKVDYMIVGLGLAGSALAWELLRRGKSLVVWDEPSNNHASTEAAGLFNPVTGRVMTKTWKADEIFPVMHSFYLAAEESLDASFLHPVPVYRPFISAVERDDYRAKFERGVLSGFISQFCDQPMWVDEVRNEFGGIEIAQSGYLDVRKWIQTVRTLLMEKESYREEHFDEALFSVSDYVEYTDVTASTIVFCNGLAARSSRWFHWLPISPLKGETLDIRVEGKLHKIYNRGVFAAPYGPSAFRVGSTYVHEPFVSGPSEEGRQELTGKLKQLLVPPFQVIHQGWGIRPTSRDRRPMLGCHPADKKVVIFNGLGTKGVSLAPYFAQQLSDWLEGIAQLSPEVNICRFKALYSGD